MEGQLLSTEHTHQLDDSFFLHLMSPSSHKNLRAKTRSLQTQKSRRLPAIEIFIKLNDIYYCRSHTAITQDLISV